MAYSDAGHGTNTMVIDYNRKVSRFILLDAYLLPVDQMIEKYPTKLF